MCTIRRPIFRRNNRHWTDSPYINMTRTAQYDENGAACYLNANGSVIRQKSYMSARRLRNSVYSNQEICRTPTEMYGATPFQNNSLNILNVNESNMHNGNVNQTMYNRSNNMMQNVNTFPTMRNRNNSITMSTRINVPIKQNKKIIVFLGILSSMALLYGIASFFFAELFASNVTSSGIPVFTFKLFYGFDSMEAINLNLIVLTLVTSIISLVVNIVAIFMDRPKKTINVLFSFLPLALIIAICTLSLIFQSKTNMSNVFSTLLLGKSQSIVSAKDINNFYIMSTGTLLNFILSLFYTIKFKSRTFF